MKGKLVLVTLIALIGFGCNSATYRGSTADYKVLSNSSPAVAAEARSTLVKGKGGDNSSTKAPDRELTYKGEAHLVRACPI